MALWKAATRGSVTAGAKGEASAPKMVVGMDSRTAWWSESRWAGERGQTQVDGTAERWAVTTELEKVAT